MSTVNKYWFVLYTRSFWERRVETLVNKLFSIEAWCPMRKISRRWSDRIKIIEEPYFRNYVFIHATDKERITALNTDGVLECVKFHGKPAQIDEEEMNQLKAFLQQHDNIEVLQLQPGERVMISEGVFAEKEGIVQQVNGDKVRILLSQLNCLLTATISDIRRVV